jgi:hypothetical protein
VARGVARPRKVEGIIFSYRSAPFSFSSRFPISYQIFNWVQRYHLGKFVGIQMRLCEIWCILAQINATLIPLVFC